MRGLLLSGFGLVLTSSAFASFDLMFVQQNAFDSALGGYRVHRFDPQTGVSLGSFSIGPQSNGLAVSYARGELYAMDINGNLRTFNYSTGEMKSIRYTGASGVQDFTISNDGTRLLIASSSLAGIRDYNLTTNVGSIVATVSGSSYDRVTMTPNGHLMVHNINGNRMERLGAVGQNFTSSGAFESLSIPASSVGQMCSISDLYGNYNYLLYGAGASGLGYNYTFTTNDNFVGFGSYTTTFTGFGSIQSAQTSHNGSYLIGADSAVPSTVRISEYDRAFYQMRTMTLTGVTGGVRNVAVVLAPEPGTLAFVGLGVAALLRRRKTGRKVA